MQVRDQLHAPLHSTPRLRAQYPLDKRLGGPQSWSGCGGEQKKSHHCPHPKVNPGHPACSLVCILIELPRIRKLMLPFHKEMLTLIYNKIMQ